MTADYLPKVTAFITRRGKNGLELLLFQHPHAGIQLPAGTVEDGETPEQAVLRETAEETGLENVRLVAKIGQRDELPPGRTHVVLRAARVCARPDGSGLCLAELRRGLGVRMEREQGGFVQVTYWEDDQFPNPNYISYQITGWVPEGCLALANRRSFFHLEAVGETPDRWEQFSDQNMFHLFWAPLNDLPEIISLQAEWLEFVIQQSGYRFQRAG